MRRKAPSLKQIRKRFKKVMKKRHKQKAQKADLALSQLRMSKHFARGFC